MSNIKFDENTRGLFLQIKHTKDDEWINISYETAKVDVEQNNESRVRKSFIFKPSSSSTGRENAAVGQESRQSGSTSISVSGSSGASLATGKYVPLPRPSQSEEMDGGQSWRPTANPVEDME